MKHLLYKTAIARCLIEPETLTNVLKYGVQLSDSEIAVRGRLSQGFNSFKTLISIYEIDNYRTSVYVWDEDAGGWIFGRYHHKTAFSEIKAHISDKSRSPLTDNAWPFIRDMLQ